ncbi:thiamine diphosphokinase [Cytobacillus sp. Hz8]|uniref:thiamine diphosphokinase n=1 Tax=Cytobacillus sp. Hz8 TaxID=3347168 RepID=UPI0035D98B78
MKIHILGGGPSELIPELQSYAGEDVIWVGVDRGVYYLISKQMEPHIAFGDFDSVSEQEYDLILNHVPNVNQYQAEKDETDMELAIEWALKQNPEIIRIFGGTGGRLDHLFANVQLLLRPIIQEKKTIIEMIDRQNIVSVRKEGKYPLKKMGEYRYISFVPISADVNNLTLEGFKYPLKDCHIPLGSTLCISNELINTYGTFSFTKGILMVIRSRD